ncbi:type II secretion system secretin GspD [Ramlibacter sp. USB13]|uniref:Type II secretion system secretin GspD n=1 Tax=Ramlibacter cellulosilyticus TaxID=2764187 RepID=A0A923SD75_9BURK|nr:type II secretion system secretin GspD [Ramlibacter cellulosilyticus]MBC5785038.1 type II secretion system secretin GspD [Ramlibacter cellulosilyticus]
MNYRSAAASLALAALLGAAPPAVQAQRAAEPITLNFQNAEIEAVARTMAAITGRNIVVDPRVKGTITLSTDRPVPPAQAFNQFVATLRLSGFAVVDAGGLLKVVPEAEAKLQSGTVSVDGTATGSQIVTQIFRLNHENAANLVPILRPLISPNNTINLNPGNNSLVITDYADNLQRLARIIAALDVSNATDVEVINLQHALAVDLAPIVQRLVDSSATGAGGTPAPQGQSDTSFRTTVIAEPRSNSLIVRASNAARLNLVRSIVTRLDVAGTGGALGNIHVVYLRNAEATKLAVVLRAALASMSPTGQGAGTNVVGTTTATSPAVTSGLSGAGATGTSAANAPITPSAQPSTGGQIQADPATNSLIITAPEPQYRQLRAVIDQLDGRRAQVLVESLLVEVNADKAAEFGIQWQTIIGNVNNSLVGVIGSNFTIGGTNIIDLATRATSTDSPVTPAPGINIGAVRNIDGRYVLSALARFFQSTGDGNVLSTPSLLTLDNEEAKIVIGQNVPFVTGQFTNTGTSNSSVNPFQTIERKDVGITLRVKPQINDNGTVRLTIYQEASSVRPGTENALNGPTTNKRQIESNVLVEDGSIVVLGGLLQDQYSGNEQKVPGLGDVPGLGNLFRTETRSRTKSNLMVFLRPVIVRDANDTDALSIDRYNLMRAKQQNVQPAPSMLLRGVEGAPISPEIAAPPPSNPNINSPFIPAPATTAPSVR